MADQLTAYITRNPGDLIAAADWNDVQVKIKEDIAARIKTAKDEVKKEGVERADNADKFDNKTPKNWTDELDKRYAPITHDHEGMAAYRRYFKRLEANQTIVLEHKLGRFPLVDIYELLPVAPTRAADKGGPINEKFYLYYHHEERDRDALFVKDRGMVRWPMGTPIEQVLGEYGVEWEDDDSLGDVVNDLLDAFFKPPVVDEMEHLTSPWIDDHRGSTIAELKRRDEWPDIRWVLRPEKLVVGHIHPFQEPSEHLVNVHHVSYDAIAVTGPVIPTTGGVQPRGGGASAGTIDLMIILRS